MHFSNVLILLLSCLVLGVAANPIAPASPLEAMIYARAAKSKGKSTSNGSNQNSTSTTTSSASGPVMVGGYAPLVLGMGMVAILGLNVL